MIDMNLMDKSHRGCESSCCWDNIIPREFNRLSPADGGTALELQGLPFGLIPSLVGIGIAIGFGIVALLFIAKMLIKAFYR